MIHVDPPLALRPFHWIAFEGCSISLRRCSKSRRRSENSASRRDRAGRFLVRSAFATPRVLARLGDARFTFPSEGDGLFERGSCSRRLTKLRVVGDDLLGQFSEVVAERFLRVVELFDQRAEPAVLAC